MRLMDFNWPEIILDLRRSGMGQHEIAKEMGPAAGESMVRQYLAGSTPTHWRGELLLALWERRTGQDRGTAPRKPAELRRMTERRPRSNRIAFMPTEHLPAVAQAYGMTVPDLLHLLQKRHRREAVTGQTLSLPGFEE